MENVSEKIRILLHYNQNIYREGLVQILRNEKSLILTAVVTGKDLLAHIKSDLPDILITCMHDREIDVVGTLPLIRRKHPQVAMLAVSNFPVTAQIVAMLSVGVLGFVIRDAPKEDMLAAIRKVHSLQPYYSMEVIAKLAGFITKAECKKFGIKPIEGVSDQDIEFLRLLCRGFSMKEISTSLRINIRTLEHRKRRLFESTNASNSAGLINYAIVNGIYNPFESAA